MAVTRGGQALRNVLEGVVRDLGRKTDQGVNLIAFSGGVDSSVVAQSVYTVFPQNTLAVLGRSASLPQVQLDQARSVASHIGIPLVEVSTSEGTHDDYLRNEGHSCYVCKTHLYSALEAVYREAARRTADRQNASISIFNGTNKDDLSDPTRVGLVAAKEFQVLSPLDQFTKAEVRAIALSYGLPNHATAASPCLRSRLAYGVRATESNLQRVENAENMVRSTLKAFLLPHHNMRVRYLKDGSARIELDKEVLDAMNVNNSSEQLVALSSELNNLGFAAVRFSEFKSGSVARTISTISS